MQALVLTFLAPSVQGEIPPTNECSFGYNSGELFATVSLDAGYKIKSAVCFGIGLQDCTFVAPNLFICCDSFTFSVKSDQFFANAVVMTHDKTISVRVYRSLLRTDLPDWQSTQFVSCTDLHAPPVFALVEITPPNNFRVKTVEICYTKCTTSGSVCSDPKLVGGDGVAFYFHGRKDHDFCLLSDRDLHINAHFIGTRPEGRSRDFTWMQSLGFVHGSHTLTIAAKRTSLWNPTIDHLQFVLKGEPLSLNSTSSWASPGGGHDTDSHGRPKRSGIGDQGEDGGLPERGAHWEAREQRAPLRHHERGLLCPL